MGFSHAEARDVLFLVIGAVSPFILRSGGDFILSFIIRRCCKMTKKELGKAMIGTGSSRVTIDRVFSNYFTWKEAYLDQGLNYCAALTVSSARLLFWHWVQPFLYGFVLYAYWNLLDHIQQILGLIVAGRECIYFILSLIAICINPSYLLLDLRATWFKDDKRFIALYVMAPEKYIAVAIARQHCHYVGTALLILFLSLLDIFGIVACVWAILVHNMYAPLMIGYSITTLGAIFFLMFGINYGEILNATGMCYSDFCRNVSGYCDCSSPVFDYNDHDLIKCGYLEKKSRCLKKWRRRYTVLVFNKKMCYKSIYTFKDERDLYTPTECIVGLDYEVTQNNEYFELKRNYDHSIFHFKCNNSSECKEWVDAIKGEDSISL
eukprot:256788_1